MKLNEVIYNQQTKQVMGRNTHSPEDIATAVKKVMQSPEFKEVSKQFRFISSARELKNGTIAFAADDKHFYWLSATGNIRTASELDGMRSKMSVGAPTGDLYQDYIVMLKTVLKKFTQTTNRNKFQFILSKHNLTTLEDIDFGDKVTILDVSYNSLNNLKGCPSQVGSFSCNGNKTPVLSLIGGPQIVTGKYEVYNSNIQSLEGLPLKIGGEIRISNNNLSSLHGCPEKVKGFNCDRNSVPLSLIGGPKIVNGSYSINNSNVSSIEGLPSKIIGHLDLRENPIHSLAGIHKIVSQVQNIYIPAQIKSNILGLLLIKNFPGSILNYSNDEEFYGIVKLLNKHLKNKDVLECQEELISNGYKEYAKL